jgi:hypothetical protein
MVISNGSSNATTVYEVNLEEGFETNRVNHTSFHLANFSIMSAYFKVNVYQEYINI